MVKSPFDSPQCGQAATNVVGTGSTRVPKFGLEGSDAVERVPAGFSCLFLPLAKSTGSSANFGIP